VALRGARASGAPDAGRGEQVTAEEKVKAKWTRTECIDVCSGMTHRKYIVTATGFNLGNGKTEAEAWEDAASRIGPDRGGER
jgi:hypothetical protein